MTQTNDLIPIQMVNRDGAAVVVKPKPGAKVKLNEAEVLFYNDIDKVMAQIILQELTSHVTDLSKTNIYIVFGRTDPRKGIALVTKEYKMDVFYNTVFILCGTRKDRFKALCWTDNRFLILYKPLKTGICNSYVIPVKFIV